MPFRHALSQSTVFTEACPHRVSDYVNQHIGNHSIDIEDRSSAPASLAFAKLDNDISMSKLSYGGQVRVRTPELHDIFHLQIVLNGTCMWRLADQDITLQPGQSMVLNPQDNVDLTYSRDCEKIIIKLSHESMTSSLLEEGFAVPDGGPRFSRHVRSLNDLRSLAQLIELMCVESEESTYDLTKRSPYQALFVHKIINAFDNNITSNSCSSHQRYFELIDEYINDNIRADISMEELAVVSAISKRTLYNLFAKYKNCTPTAYIKHKKLTAIQRLLCQQNHLVRNITEVALDFGFTHLGRFSSDYKRVFGELPSTTFKRC